MFKVQIFVCKLVFAKQSETKIFIFFKCPLTSLTSQSMATLKKHSVGLADRTIKKTNKQKTIQRF